MHRPKKSWYRKMVPIDLLNTCLHTCPLICPTLCNPMDCSLPGSSVHGILQAITLKWVAMPFSRGSSWPRDWTCVSCTAARFFTTEPRGKPLCSTQGCHKSSICLRKEKTHISAKHNKVKHNKMSYACLFRKFSFKDCAFHSGPAALAPIKAIQT